MDMEDQELARFMEASHCSLDQAQFFLEASGGDFERALNMFYEQTAGGGGGGGGSSMDARRPHPPDVPLRPRPAAAAAGAPAGAVGAYNAGGGALAPPLRLLNAVLGAPFAVLGGSVRLLVRTLGFTASLATAVARRVLPTRLTNTLAGAARALTVAGGEVPPAAAAAEFVRQFSGRYGDCRPRWLECGWGEAASRAHQEGKFLFIYLHSPQHQDTDSYCRDTLCNPEFVEFVNQQFVCWGGDLSRSDAFRLASSLRVAGYPYTGLLAFSGPRTRLITCVEGRIAVPRLVEVLQAGLNDHGALLWQEQMERQQRDTDRQLREEQDAEYQRSLEADRLREQQRQQQQREAAAAEQAAREAADRARAEAEAAEQQQAEAEAALRRRKSEKQLALPAEPPAGTPASSLIRVRMPDGSNHQRRFMMADPLQRVYDFVDSLESVRVLKYSLATTFPRRVYGPDSVQRSLQDLDLAPQAVLLLQPEDD